MTNENDSTFPTDDAWTDDHDDVNESNTVHVEGGSVVADGEEIRIAAQDVDVSDEPTRAERIEQSIEALKDAQQAARRGLDDGQFGNSAEALGAEREDTEDA